MRARLVGMVVLILVLAASCRASSTSSLDEPAGSATSDTASAVDEPTSAPAEATPEPAVEATATPEPTPTLAAADMIAAAMADFDASPQPAELIAWDHIDAESFDSNVRLRVCGWTGEDIYDSVWTVEYQVLPGADGGIEVNHLFEATSPGDCLNTELIDSALAHVHAYEDYWGSVRLDPASFDAAAMTSFATADQTERNENLAAGWVADDVVWRGITIDEPLPESALTDVVWRRFTATEGDLMEIISCRPQDPSFGLYRGDLLVTDQTGGGVFGEHIIHRHRLVREGDSWRVFGVTANLWSDCFGFEPNWLDGVNNWQPDPVPWQALADA